MQATNGILYGVTDLGGDYLCSGGCGTVFQTMGIAPFVETTPNFGRPGWNVGILGNNLTGATSVTFNGVQAKAFTVFSSTLIKATVPTHATVGPIVVTTPSGVLTSNAPFQIIQ